MIVRSITNQTGSKTVELNISIPNNCTINNDGSILFTGSISGDGGIFINGSGTLVLSGSNTYSGATVVRGGTLRAGNETCFGSGAITVSAGATLDKAGFNIANTVVNNGGTVIGIVNPSNTVEQVRAAANAAHRFARSGFQAAPPEVLATREATCRACPEWDAFALNGTGRCRKCGCSTWAKLRMATERCPLGKWHSI